MLKTALAVMAVIPLTLFAAGEKKSPPSPSTSTATPANKASSVLKKNWIENIKTRLPTLICQQDQYFVQCFHTTTEECNRLSKLLVEACVNNIALALPLELTPSQGTYWGQVVGRCNHDLYEKLMESKKHHTPNCEAVNTPEKHPTPNPPLEKPRRQHNE